MAPSTEGNYVQLGRDEAWLLGFTGIPGRLDSTQLDIVLASGCGSNSGNRNGHTGQSRSAHTDWLREGPLAPDLDAYMRHLTERGCGRRTIVGYLACLAHLLIVHPKNGEQVWIPLFKRRGKALVQLFPELMKRLDDIKRNRIGGLMFYRDWPDAKTGRRFHGRRRKGDLTYVRHWTKKAVVAAALAADLSFTSFRHGGLTELGDSRDPRD